jgi:hypothetical protein
MHSCAVRRLHTKLHNQAQLTDANTKANPQNQQDYGQSNSYAYGSAPVLGLRGCCCCRTKQCCCHFT